MKPSVEEAHSLRLVRLHPYAVNRTKRIIKTAKVYWADTGLALHLAGLDEPSSRISC
jgi:predicted AAA+ superfamily ATPase